MSFEPEDLHDVPGRLDVVDDAAVGGAREEVVTVAGERKLLSPKEQIITMS